jgi:hypothetical protein
LTGLEAGSKSRPSTAIGILVLSQTWATTFARRLVADEARGVGHLVKDRIHDLQVLADAGASRGPIRHRSEAVAQRVLTVWPTSGAGRLLRGAP